MNKLNIHLSFQPHVLSQDEKISNNENRPKTDTQTIYNLLFHSEPLSLVYKDLTGRTFQLLKTPHIDLIGTSIDEQGVLTILPGKRVKNALNPQETPEELIYRLQSYPIRVWGMAFDSHRLILTVWPHLIASGRYDHLNFQDVIKDVQECYEKLTDVYLVDEDGNKLGRIENHRKLESETYVKTKGGGLNGFNYRAVHNESKGKFVKLKGGELLLNKKGNPYNHAQKVSQAQREAINLITDIKDRLKQHERKHDLSPEEKTILEKELSKVCKTLDASKKYTPPQKLEKAQRKLEKAQRQNSPKSKSPANKDFQQRLGQTGLTKSYNSTNKDNPISEEGPIANDIGGVACSTAYIEGLFDSPIGYFFEKEHTFCLPGLPDGKIPFSNDELSQIIRELTIGIYVDGTLPFFSLHFNQNADMFPVIHPAYENTLVGRVISMLDYIMKGYLNGGVFNEDFVDQWHKDPDWSKKGQSSLTQLLDFTEMCQKLQGEDQNYNSLMMRHPTQENILDKLEALLGINEETNVLKNLSGFRNSFRIIAKQNSFKKEGNLFLIDSDFDVLYTISPTPEYQAALEAYVRQHGSLPSSYVKLENDYKLFCQRIHDHMVKIPICRDYFAMLSVISFFSAYLSTLKKHRKIPILPMMAPCSLKGCPPLFPHLPISSILKIPLKVDYEKSIKSIFDQNQDLFTNYYSQRCKKFLDWKLPDFTKQRKNLFDIIHDGIFHSLPSSNSHIRSLSLERLKASPDVRDLCMYAAGCFMFTFDTCIYDACENYRYIVLAYPNSTIRGEITKIIDQFLKTDHSNYKEDLTGLSPALFAKLPNNFSGRQNLTTLDIATVRIKTELPNEEVEKGKKLVGGCGIKLKQQALQTSEIAKNILQTNWSKLQNLNIEEWTEVTYGPEKKKGFAFRLAFTDVPAELSDDYVWMESCLLAQNDVEIEAIEERLAILAEIDEGSKQGFLEAISRSKKLTELKDRYQRDLMHHAAKYSDPFFVKGLLSKGLTATNEDVHGYQPIHYAAMNGCLKTLQELLHHNPSHRLLEARSRNGSTPLIVAIQNGQAEIVRYLLSQNLTDVTLTEGYNTLHCALHQGNLEIIHLLLDNPKLVENNINTLSEEGGTPLMLACELDSVELIEKMLTLNANPNIERKDGVTALEIAVRRNCESVVECLLKKARPSTQCIETIAKQGSVTMASLIEHQPYFYDHVNSYHDTFLHTAIRFGNFRAAVYIAHSCKNIDYLLAQNKGKETAFCLAMDLGFWLLIRLLFNKTNHSRFISTTQLKNLLKLEYNPILKDMIDQVSITPAAFQNLACEAAQCGNYLALSYVFIPRGIKLESIKGPNDWLLPHFLAKFDGLMLFKGCVIKDQNILQPLSKEGNQTLPYIAASHKSLRVLRFLLQEMKKRDISLENHYHDRHLFYAAVASADTPTVQLFLEIYQDRKKELVNAILDKTGECALHLAVREGALSLVKLLISEGADGSVENKNGENALHLALHLDDDALTSYLLAEHPNTLINATVLAMAATAHKGIYFERIINMNTSQTKLNEALCLAIQDYNAIAFLRLYQKGASLQFVSSTGSTPLILASATGQTEILEIILKEQPRIDPSSSAKNELAEHARETIIALGLHDKSSLSKYGSSSPDMVTLLLNSKSDKEKPDLEQTALLEAAKNGHIHCVDLILKAGNNNTHQKQLLEASKNNYWLTTLLTKRDDYTKKITEFSAALLAMNGNFEKLISMINALPLNEPIQIESEDGLMRGTPLQLFLRLYQNEAKDVVKSLLLKKDLNPNIRDCHGNTLVHLLLRADIFPNMLLSIDWSGQNHEGKTPLHMAVEHASFHTVEAVLDELTRLNLLHLQNTVDTKGRTPIFCCVANREEHKVIALIKSKAELNIRDHSLVTPLSIAISTGWLGLVRHLLKAGANPNQTITVNQIYPLYLSMSMDLDELTRCLLSYGAKYNIKSSDKNSLLHLAAQMGNTQFLHLLTAKDLSLDDVNLEGRYPIHMAALYGHTETVKTLISMDPGSIDAASELPLNSVNKDTFLEGITPLHLATCRNETETIRFLLKNRVKLENQQRSLDALSFAAPFASRSTIELFAPYKISKDPTVLCQAAARAIMGDNLDALIYFFNLGIPVNAILSNELTGIQIAAKFGALQCTQWLLQKGADSFLQTSQGEDSLQLSAANDSFQQFALMIQCVEPDLDEIRGNRETLMHTVAKKGNINHLIFLIKHGCSLDVQDMRGNSPLHVATEHGKTAVIDLLLACGADSSLTTANKQNLADLVQRDDKITQEILKKYRPILAKSSKLGDTPIHLAVRSRNILALLLAIHSGDINEANSVGVSPLHLAAEMGHLEACRYLLEAGADIEALDSDSQTPLSIACMNYYETAEFLIHAGADRNIKNATVVSLIQKLENSRLPWRKELVKLLQS